MRWLVIGLLVSVGALLFVAVALARYVRNHRKSPGLDSADRHGQAERHRQLDEALDLPTPERTKPRKDA